MNPPHDFDELITRALRSAPIEPPPHDLVPKTLALVDGSSEAATDRLENWLQVGLLVVLFAAAAVALVRLGGDWLAHEMMAGGNMASWVLAAMACLAVSFPVHRWTHSRAAARDLLRSSPCSVRRT